MLDFRKELYEVTLTFPFMKLNIVYGIFLEKAIGKQAILLL